MIVVNSSGRRARIAFRRADGQSVDVGRGLRRVALAAVLACVGFACRTEYRAKFVETNATQTIDEHAPFLKCHLADGGVVVLRDFKIDTKVVTGTGIAYDAYRARVGPMGKKEVALSDIVLFETNEARSVSQIGYYIPVLVSSAVSTVMTVFCITNPKACFGSCPTFYADDGNGLALQAEGFSAAIAKSLEETDVDAMWTVHPTTTTLDVLMTNDALETHDVRSVRLLYAPRPSGTRVLRAGSRYVVAKKLVAPVDARDEAGRDVTASLRATDGSEYKSDTDGSDLATRETVDVRFPETHGRRGLLVVARNSLLETFLFYQLLAYMGRRAGDHMAYLERFGKEPFAGVGRVLGDIDVSVRGAEGAWSPVGAYAEVGPIAREAQLIPLPDDAPSEVRLTMARGNFRIEQVALVELGDDVTPTAIEPKTILRDGKEDPVAKAALLDPAKYLITLPGDAYTLRFELPGTDGELFLESRGFYTEWMRDEWLRDEDETEAARMLLRPEDALRRLAPKFKAMEGDMDRIFWQSRVTRH